MLNGGDATSSFCLTAKSKYNGTVTDECDIFLSTDTSNDFFPKDTLLLNVHSANLKNSSFWKLFSLSQNGEWIGAIKSTLSQIFLPQGYPQTVTNDYLEYQLWDTIQAFASSINGALATTAVFKGVGVGSSSASVLAASITWILKDGTGMVGRIIFAWAKGTALDSDCKKWRLVADALNDFAFFLDIVASHFPSTFFMPMACTSSLLRSIVGVAGAATRTSVVRHQARRENLADVAAKDGSQETVVNLVSLLVSLALLPLLDGQPTLVWIFFVMCTILHLYSNFRAVRSLRLDVLNQTRFKLCIRSFVDNGNVLEVEKCNVLEPIFTMVGGQRFFGCALNKVPLNGHLHRVVNNSSTFCVFDNVTESGWIVLETDVSEDIQFSAAFQLEYFAITKTWPNLTMESIFRQKLIDAGWVPHVYQLNFDEWRICYSTSKSKII